MVDQAPEHIEPGTVLAGRYRIVRPLGSGGMGSVYLVEHLHTDQQLALKLLHATIVKDEIALTRFRREARAPAKVGSDHVVQVTDADVAPELGGVPFLVMEWLRGHDLEELSKARGTLPPNEVVGYLRQAARALDKAHALGIVHRDLKPENLFLTTREDGAPWIKILDFGIAKLTKGEAEPGLKATGTGQIFGTPFYMAPEQIKAELDRVSPQTDIWALGIIAHRLLVGKEPWTALTITHLVAQIAYEPMPIPSANGSTLGGAFDDWFLHCCAREPEGRFKTAGEAVAALGKALGVEAEPPRSSALPMSAPLPSIPRSRPHEAATAFSATAPARSAPVLAPNLIATTESPSPRRPGTAVYVAGAALLVGAGLAAALLSRDSAHPATGLATSTPVEPTPSITTSAVALAPASAEAPIVTPSPPVASASAAPASSAQHPDKLPPRVAGPRPSGHASAPTAAPATAAPVAPPPPPPPQDDPLGSRH